MQIITILAIFSLLIATVWANSPQCTYEGKSLSPGDYTINCVHVVCDEYGTIHSEKCVRYGIKCALGYNIEWREQDNSKPFPECCRKPKCVKDLGYQPLEYIQQS